MKIILAINLNYILKLIKICFSSSKRGVDFGLARGFSGSQALKHALGLEAARYAGGPGRKKRTDPSAGPMEE